MVTLAEKPEPPPSRREQAVDAVYTAAGGANRLARVSLAGTPRGHVRRPILFIIAGICLALNVPAVGIVALLLLALGDALMEVE